jgi:hypothetical protein
LGEETGQTGIISERRSKSESGNFSSMTRWLVGAPGLFGTTVTVLPGVAQSTA